MNWAPGTSLGPYELVSLIGAGGMGEVWKARDTRLGRTVAIKRVTVPHLHRFEQEARTISALNHANICQIYDVGTDYLVLEHIDGQPLRGPLPAAEVTKLALQIASALDEAHRQGILHRDVKPANILLTGSGTPKLLDFGLAKLMTAAQDATCTGAGVIVGTAAYMSPEQAEGRPLDVRSDIFSLGAVLYELLAGRRAFAGHSTIQVLTALLQNDPPPLQASSGLERIVMRCLRKRPEDRYQSVGEVSAALEQLQATAPRHTPSSIAVLPFANRSADKDNEYFSDGLTEEIINALSRIPDLKVTARTSAFAFRGKEEDIRKIADALGVGTILEGSVRRSLARIRVTAQLVSAADGYHLWSGRYDRELADVFEVQEEIAAAIAGALQVTLAGGDRVAKTHTPNLAAYEAYLRARHEAQQLTPEGLARSQHWYERAIDLDAGFALAHGMLSFHYVLLANYGLLPAHEAMPVARSEAEKALEIDPDLPEGHAMLGIVASLYDYDWEAAARHFTMAMAREPVSSEVRRNYALYFLLPVGRFDDAIRECALALQTDPINLLGRVRFAQCLQAAGRNADASSELRHVLALDPALWFTHFVLAFEQLQEGGLAEAASHADEAAKLAPWNPSAAGLLAATCRLTGETLRADSILTKLRSGRPYGVPLALATFHLACAELDAAADWTARIIAERHPAVFFFLRTNGRALRESPRWLELEKLLKLPLE